MATKFLPRSAWTSTAAGGATLGGSKLFGTSVHYPGDGNVTYLNLTQEEVAAKLRAYRAFHVNVRGWSDIGYQVAGDQSGRVWDLRGIGRVPAASASESNPDANLEWGAFLMVIGNSEAPSPALIRAFQDWRFGRWLVKWPGKTGVRGHRQVPGAQTSCPGSRVVALIDNGTLSQKPADSPAPPTTEVDVTPEDIEKVADAVWHRLTGYTHHDPNTGQEYPQKFWHAVRDNPEVTTDAVWFRDSGLKDENGQPLSMWQLLRKIHENVLTLSEPPQT